ITQQQWRQLCVVLDRASLANDERFATNAARMTHRTALVREIVDALAARTTDEWVEALLAAGVPAGPIHDYAQALSDPRTSARHMVLEIAHPVEGVVQSLGCPVKMSDTPLGIRRPPPLLGEHSAEILGELEAWPGDDTIAGGDAR